MCTNYHVFLLLCWNVVKIWKLSAKSASIVHNATATDIKTVVITVHDDARHTVANRIGRIEASKTECSKTECSQTECSKTECSQTECSQTECSKTSVLIARLLPSLLGDITVQILASEIRPAPLRWRLRLYTRLRNSGKHNNVCR